MQIYLQKFIYFYFFSLISPSQVSAVSHHVLYIFIDGGKDTALTNDSFEELTKEKEEEERREGEGEGDSLQTKDKELAIGGV